MSDTKQYNGTTGTTGTAKTGQTGWDAKTGCDTKNGHIGCDAKNCTYNPDGYSCSADHIDVTGQRAKTEGETNCSTFRNKEGMQV